jgi:hypothetical protein
MKAKIIELVLRALAGWVPRRLAYWVLIRAISRTSTGRLSHVEMGGISAVDVLKDMQ